MYFDETSTVEVESDFEWGELLYTLPNGKKIRPIFSGTLTAEVTHYARATRWDPEEFDYDIVEREVTKIHFDDEDFRDVPDSEIPKEVWDKAYADSESWISDVDSDGFWE